MIYAVSKKQALGGEVYVLFETNSESFFEASDELAKILVETFSESIKNMSLTRNKITIKPWPNEMYYSTLDDCDTGAEYVLVCQVRKDQFKLVSYEKEIIYTGVEQLREFITEYRVANCDIVNGKIFSADTYKSTKDTKIEEYIAEKYEIYKTKSAALGLDRSFDYIIEGQEVKLKKYTGTSDNVIVPKFITSIMEGAFRDCRVKRMLLELGLKYIGSYAFEGCDINDITIPETVELIGVGAFYENRKLITNTGEYKKGRIKILSRKTIAVDKYMDEIQ